MRRACLSSTEKASAYRASSQTANCATAPRKIPATFDFHPHVLVAPMLVRLLLFAAAVGFICPLRAAAQAPLTAHADASSSPALVLAFVGGFVHPDDARHSEVQIVGALQSTYGNEVQVEIFRNRDRERAHQFVLAWRSHRDAGHRASDENQNPPLILFGHSWGASAVVALARELQHDGIPVSLTIQVDSVRKHGQDDSIIPANVAEAINFYQPDGIVHGRSQITAADPSRTKILGNLRFKYEREPRECRAYPWYDRLFFRGHTAIECDPRVWSQVETLIRNRLPSHLTSPQNTIAAGTR